MRSPHHILELILKRTVLPVFTGFLLISLVGIFIRTVVPPSISEASLEQIVIRHQKRAAKAPTPRDVLFIGDSSCLMNVSARDLNSRSNSLSYLNLGMLSIMPIPSFAELVSDHAKANPNSPKYVVLIVHPEMLNLPLPTNSPVASVPSTVGVRKSLLLTTGIQQLFVYLSQSLLPYPLPGRYGRFYGFDVTFEKYLDANYGSAIDPFLAPLRRSGQRFYTISEDFSHSASEFRNLLPSHPKLLLALSPIPETSAPPDFLSHHRELLLRLSSLLQAEILDLPATLPDVLFSTATHLRPEYRQQYTSRVFSELQRILDADKEKLSN